MNYGETKENTRNSFITKAVFMLMSLWFVSFYTQTAAQLWHGWQADSYSHGALIPLIALFWIITLLQKKPLVPASSASGTILVFIGITLKLIGELIANNWLSQISIPLTITGLIIVFLGIAITKHLIAPLFFLFFSIPLPVTITPLLTAKMQLLSSDLGMAGFHFLGISAFQEGNIIDLGEYKLQIAEACSGLQYLFPLMSFGYLIAFYFFQNNWKRIALFLSTLPIAILMNGARITLTGMVVEWGGVTLVEGAMHKAEGFIVFAFCLTGLALIAWGLKQCGNKKSMPQDYADLISFKKPLWQKPPYLSKLILSLLVILISFSGIGTYFITFHIRGSIPKHTSFTSFPMQIKGWSGQQQNLSQSELESLKLDDYILASYTNSGNSMPVTLYIVYYKSQQQGRSIHSPQVCLPSSGWKILSRSQKEIILPYSHNSLIVTKEIIQKGTVQQLAYYWIREGGYDTTSTLQAKWQLMKNSVLSNRTDGSLIRLTTPITREQNQEQAEKILEIFINEIFQLL